MKALPGFGLIIIGTEVLAGRYPDKHFHYGLRLLKEHGHELRYATIIPDDPKIIVDELRRGMKRPEGFFCFGGIGATPDDHTRKCAAKAAGLPVVRHPEGARHIEELFGPRAYPVRIRMADLPRGAKLIPNGVGKIAGFSVGKHYFLPGFPEMSEPMMAWVLDRFHPRGAGKVTRGCVVPGRGEGDLVLMMEEFVAAHPKVSFYSLPSFGLRNKEVRLGVTGLPAAAARGFADLTRLLDRKGVKWVKE